MRIELEEIVDFDEEKGEFVKAKWENLPICEAVVKYGMIMGGRCDFRARWRQNGRPACGHHAGRPGTTFTNPVRLLRERVV